MRATKLVHWGLTGVEKVVVTGMGPGFVGVRLVELGKVVGMMMVTGMRIIVAMTIGEVTIAMVEVVVENLVEFGMVVIPIVVLVSRGNYSGCNQTELSK